MAVLLLGTAFILQILIFQTTEALLCYNCTNLADPRECLALGQCDIGESCFLHFNSVDNRSTLGCIDNKQCGVSAPVGGNLIGRGISERQASQDCHECCSTSKCNKALCVHKKPTACEDDAKVDCAFMNSFMNVCTDVQRAKIICPKFCSLCSLVDGAWGEWTAWSDCAQSCGNGTNIRLRRCNNPAPADGGLDCVGSNVDLKTCMEALCPVNGGWTKWSNWGSCSVSCGVGLEKRRRDCSNPAPKRNGKQCIGDAFDAKTCSPGACADGGWSNWAVWSTCSATCGDGLQSRSRSCSHPTPSLLGKFCDGDSSQVKMCHRSSCTPNIAFKVITVRDKTPTPKQKIVFAGTLLNHGHAYDTSTGVFTAPVSGTYFFTTQFCTLMQKVLNYDIKVYGRTYATGKAYGDNSLPCNTADTVAVLHANSKVWVECTYVASGLQIYEDAAHQNSFAGYLIHQ